MGARAATAASRLDAVAAGGALPAWCDRFLDAPPPAAGEFFATRLWFDATVAHALPPGAGALCAAVGPGDAVLLPLLAPAAGGAAGALATPYTRDWRPLPAPGAAAAARRAAGRALGEGPLLRRRPPLRLEALDPDAPGLTDLLAGLRRAGIVVLRHDNFGNWHEALAPGTGWDAYLAARPPALRTTIRRKLARAGRETAFDLIAAPGAALEAGVAAYEDVRARSWKPHEPAPDFDGALMRAAAAAGALRLGVLRSLEDGRPVAAQYWVLDRGGARATVLKLAHAEGARAASPGTALTAMMVRRLLDEDGVGELDFGRGDDPYKRLWVGRRRQRIGLVLADPMHPAGLAAIARHAAGRARRRLRGWLARPDGAAEAGGSKPAAVVANHANS